MSPGTFHGAKKEGNAQKKKKTKTKRACEKDIGANLRGMEFLITKSDTSLETNNYNNGI